MSIEMRAKWGNLVKGVGLEISEAVYQGADTYMPGVLSVLHTENTDAAQVNYTDFTDFTPVGYRDEADNAIEQTRYKGFDSKYIVDSVSGTVLLTQESINDNQLGDALNAAKFQGKSMQIFVDKAGYQLFNQGFDTNATDKGGYKLNWFADTKPQFSVAHPSAVPGGSTQSNASATGIAVTEDNVEVAELALEAQKDDLGEMLDFTGNKMILASNELRRKLKIITESTQKTNSDYNDVNIYADGTISFMTTKYLGAGNKGSATQWFFIDTDSHKLYHVDREGITMDTDYNGRNRTYEYTIHRRFATVSKGWKATWGSKGGGANYTA